MTPTFDLNQRNGFAVGSSESHVLKMSQDDDDIYDRFRDFSLLILTKVPFLFLICFVYYLFSKILTVKTRCK